MKNAHTEEITIRVKIEEPSEALKLRVRYYRQGQLHRRENRGCLRANGEYLDGWYEPDKIVPPYITEAQMRAFKL